MSTQLHYFHCLRSKTGLPTFDLLSESCWNGPCWASQLSVFHRLWGNMANDLLPFGSHPNLRLNSMHREEKVHRKLRRGKHSWQNKAHSKQCRILSCLSVFPRYANNDRDFPGERWVWFTTTSCSQTSVWKQKYNYEPLVYLAHTYQGKSRISNPFSVKQSIQQPWQSLAVRKVTLRSSREKTAVNTPLIAYDFRYSDQAHGSWRHSHTSDLQISIMADTTCCNKESKNPW